MSQTHPHPAVRSPRSLPSWRVWLLAARPATLPAAVVPVLVGTAAAVSEGAYRAGALAAALISAVCIQIGTNLANDLFDFRKGADSPDRLGPMRVTQAGLRTEAQVIRAMVVAFGLAFLSGLYLVALGGWPILVVGLISIAMGIAYTGGPWALAYRGLGDVFTFVFFGPVAVLGTYLVHADRLSITAALASLPVGLLVTAILVVNNLRDIETDRAAGKKTLAVRIGRRATQIQYTVFLIAAYFVPLAIPGGRRAMMALPWITLPLAILLIRLIMTQSGRALNRGLAGTGVLHLLYGLIFSAALLS